MQRDGLALRSDTCNLPAAGDRSCLALRQGLVSHWSLALAGSCGIKPWSTAGPWVLRGWGTDPLEDHRLQILGLPRLCHLHFPNLLVLPKQILPFPGETSPQSPTGAAPSVPPWVWGLQWGACASHVPPTTTLCFAGAAVICGLSCLVLIQF